VQQLLSIFHKILSLIKQLPSDYKRTYLTIPVVFYTSFAWLAWCGRVRFAGSKWLYFSPVWYGKIQALRWVEAGGQNPFDFVFNHTISVRGIRRKNTYRIL